MLHPFSDNLIRRLYLGLAFNALRCGGHDFRLVAINHFFLDDVAGVVLRLDGNRVATGYGFLLGLLVAKDLLLRCVLVVGLGLDVGNSLRIFWLGQIVSAELGRHNLQASRCGRLAINEHRATLAVDVRLRLRVNLLLRFLNRTSRAGALVQLAQQILLVRRGDGLDRRCLSGGCGGCGGCCRIDTSRCRRSLQRAFRLGLRQATSDAAKRAASAGAAHCTNQHTFAQALLLVVVALG